MEKITKVIMILILIALPVSYAGDFAYNRLCSNQVEIISPLDSNGAVTVSVQDQTTNPADIKVNQNTNSNISLNQSTIINSYNIILNTGHLVSVGDNIGLFQSNGIQQFLYGEVLNVNVNNITIDTPVSFEFNTSVTFVFTFDNDLTVDGSVTTQIFRVINVFNKPVDITRFIFNCLDNTVMDDSKFCGINRLTRGIVLRKQSQPTGFYNYWNVKSNGEWGELAFDKDYNDKAPAGFYGFTSRLSYAGASKHGVTIRLQPGESIELLIQDDLTSITSASLMVEGHFVEV